MNSKDIRTLSVTLSLLVVMVQNSYEKPIDEPLTKEHHVCLLECLTCVELWGSMYNGPACANGCSLTNGGSIDTGCKQGVNVVKRYEEIRAKDQCKKDCFSCSSRSRHYDGDACLDACELNGGQDRDSRCTRFVTYYGFESIFGVKRQ